MRLTGRNFCSLTSYIFKSNFFQFCLEQDIKLKMMISYLYLILCHIVHLWYVLLAFGACIIPYQPMEKKEIHNLTLHFQLFFHSDIVTLTHLWNTNSLISHKWSYDVAACTYMPKNYFIKYNQLPASLNITASSPKKDLMLTLSYEGKKL